jgi:hypothetical protein
VDKFQHCKYPYCHISHTPFLEGYLSKLLGYFKCARWNRGWIFLCNIKAFLDGILLIFHAQEICKSTAHNQGLHPMSLTMISVPPLTAPFSSQRQYFNRQIFRVMPLMTSSAGAIIYSTLLTKSAVTGCYEVHPGILRGGNCTQ